MNKFVVLTDTRQQKEQHIIKEFDKQGILHIQTKLDSADYMALRYDEEKGFYKDYSILVDTKKDLLEICGNLAHTSEHQRLVREVDLAHKLNCSDFIFLIGEKNIKNIDDIKNWSNKHTKVKGETLYKIMCSFKEHHNCRFIICDKKDLGKKVIELLGGKND
jgi:hypothetical protein